MGILGRIIKSILDFLRFLVKSALITVLAGSVIGALFCFAVLGPRALAVHGTALECVESITDNTFKQSQNSYVWDKNGVLLAKLMDGRDSIYLESYEIPDRMKKMVIAVEDKRYMEHNGVDYKAVAKAIVELFQNDSIVRGGSTISQQLARNVFLNFDQKFDRKLCEMIISTELEKKYTKAEILEFYLNNICYGGNVYGLGAAAQRFFSKEAKDLTLNEMAYLTGLPQSPTRYNPLNGVEAGMERRDVVLGVLLKENVITQKEYDDCIAEPIELKLSHFELNDYMTSYATFCGVEKLMALDGFDFQYVFETQDGYDAYKQKYDESYAYHEHELRTGGYEIYTSLDSEIQEKVQEIVSTNVHKETELQGAVAVYEVATGLPIAVVGGIEPSADYLTFNRAYQAYRQPGSSLKPIIAYLPYLEQDGVNVSTTIPDKKRDDGIKNYDNQYWHSVSIFKAIQWSKNTPAVWCMEQVGIRNCVNRLGDLGFRKIVSDYNPSAALGGLTYGVSPVEMASAYATIGNKGVGRPADCIVQLKHDDKVIYQRKYTDLPQVFDESAVEEVKVGLSAVLAGGTGVGFKIPDAFAKTGTTSDNKDSWMCGFDADYAVAVWTGYDMPATIKQTALAGRIWKETMLYLRTLPAPKPVEQTVFVEVAPPVVEDISTPASENIQNANAEETPSISVAARKQEVDRYLDSIRTDFNYIISSSDYNVIDAYNLLDEMKRFKYAEDIQVYSDALAEHLKQY